ncbi:CIC11C00000002633 [Sungouiella intermedia]|uniref:Protein transport protein SEC31 n=1 Tax=Sungouiella intermedia TaxID=45354 RepID=A0A1L0G4I6_9ASCO|nr:CIC11C00000002633 [[Candida] intermedia]
MKIKEIIGTSTFAWSSDVIPLLAVGSAAGAIDLNFSALSLLELWDPFGPNSNSAIFSANLDDKFCALAWLRPFGNYRRGVLVGAIETGELKFWDADVLVSTKSLSKATIHTSTKHSGAVKCLLFNPHLPHVLATGGKNGEIYIWDIRTFADPFAPGRAMTPMDEILCVSWNNAVSHILATTSNGGYTSIWDLKSKREVLHLSYNGDLGRADFSCVSWHPLQLTKLATASQSDGCPLIMTWDLRNASEPEKILQGHQKGILSIDWCLQDPEFLISSGKDNSTILWNPISGIKLGEYPVAANWTFLTKFAPKAPDVIATASFDGKIVIQTLQDTSPPLSEQVKASDEKDFWSNIATTENHRAEFDVQQAPLWLKNPSGVSFGFGSKIVVFKSENGKSSVSISKVATDNLSNAFADELCSAAQSNNYTEIINAKIKEEGEKSDWELLHKLAEHGKSHLFQNIVEGSEVQTSEDSNGTEQKDDTLEDNEDATDGAFFQNLAHDFKNQKNLSRDAVYVPSGEFKILDTNQSATEAALTRSILSNKIEDAVTVCLEEGKLMEALVLSLDLSASVKEKVKNHYFKNHNDVLSRLIYSASSGDVLDIVSNADIANWKEIASSISAYSKDELDFNSKIEELGDRILASNSGDKESRDNALLCYLAGGALDKVCAIWLKEMAHLEKSLLHGQDAVASPFDARWSALGNFVEKLAAYRSISHINEPLSGPSIEPVCKAVFEFSSMTATGGHFELANHFLNILPEDFAGLKAEKLRIATALGLNTNKEPAKANNYGRKKSIYAANGLNTNRYQNPRASVSHAVPALRNPLIHALSLDIPRASVSHPVSGLRNALIHALSPEIPRMTPAAPTKRPSYSAAAPTNPYMPSGAAAGGAGIAPANPYSMGASASDPISNPNIALGNPQQPAMPVGPTGSVRPPSTPTIAAPFTPLAPQYSVPARPASAMAVSNAPPPKPSYKVETDGWNDLPDTFKTLKPARRAAAATPGVALTSPVVASTPTHAPAKKPVVSSPVIPPPPKNVSRLPSKTSVTMAPLQSRNTLASNKYAPPPGSSPVQPPNGGSSLHNHSNLSGNIASAPPKNPYAPSAAPAGPSKVTYAPPPSNTFAPPKSANISPTGGHLPNPYAPSAPVNPPVRPSSRQLGSPIARPPSRQYVQPSPPKPPTSSSRHAQPSGQIAPPPMRAASSQVPSPHLPGPPVSAPPVSAPAVSAPPARAAPSSAPPVNAPPVSAPPVSAPPVSAPPANTPPVSAPPTSRTVSGAPPKLSAPPTHGGPRSQMTPPPPRSARTGRTASISSVTLTLTTTYPVGGGDRSQIPEGSKPIFTTFTKYLEEIKPAAPPKYTKHVADMEKRLNILFDHLNKQDLLTEGAVELLRDVASKLENKNYTGAASSNDAILAQHANEVGAWHTGVKRLITMAEAFDS